MSFLGASFSVSRRELLRLACATPLLPIAVRGQSRGELRLLVSGESAQQTALIDALRSRWVRGITIGDAANTGMVHSGALAYVAIGPRAFQQALHLKLDAPLVAVHVSRQAYEGLLEQAGQDVRAVTGVYAEASPVHQLRTVAAVMRRPVAVGVLASERAEHIRTLLKAAADALKLTLRKHAYEAAAGMSRNLLRLSSADVLLIYPDSEIFTSTTLRELLESTYRRRQPVFGYSEALVRAGTLASAHSSADDLAAHLVDVLGGIAAGHLPAPQYPRYWRVAINDSVARSLDIVVEDAARTLGDRP